MNDKTNNKPSVFDRLKGSVRRVLGGEGDNSELAADDGAEAGLGGKLSDRRAGQEVPGIDTPILLDDLIDTPLLLDDFLASTPAQQPTSQPALHIGAPAAANGLNSPLDWVGLPGNGKQEHGEEQPPRFKVGLGESLAVPVLEEYSIIREICGLGVSMGKVRTLRGMGLGVEDPAVASEMARVDAQAEAILGVLRDYPDRAGETQVVEGREVGTALLYAAAIGHAGIMKYMMERGADADQVLEGPGLLPGMASMTTNIPEKLGVADALGIFAPDLASFYRNAGVLMVPDEQEISGVISRAQAGRSEWAHALDKQVQMRAVLMKTGAPINVSAGGRTGHRGPRL